MGYVVYITRRKHWFDESGPEISLKEWQRIVTDSPEIVACPELGEHYFAFSGAGSPWVHWEEGNLESKNPSQEFLVVLAALAVKLNAKLVGEEGETYNADGEAIPVPANKVTPSWRDWVDYFKGLVEYAFPKNLKKSPYKVGDRLRTHWGREGRVVKVDMRALGGMGVIEVDFGNGNVIGMSGDDVLQKVED